MSSQSFIAYMLVAIYTAITAFFCEWLGKSARLYWWIFSVSMFALLLVKFAVEIIRALFLKGV